MNNDTYIPDRGDIILLILDPRVGHEQPGRRPALVLSPRLLAERTALSVVCPITSNPKGLPFEIELKGTKTKGAVLPIHVRSVDVLARRAKFIEQAPSRVLAKTTQAVQVMIDAVS